MRIRSRSTQNQGIPTASMADIAFLLIIFFLLTLNIQVDKTQVELPTTVIRQEPERRSAYISITENGVIRVSSGEEVSVTVPSPADVLSFASTVVAQNPDKEFVLKADKEVPYSYVDQVIDALKQAQARVIYLLSDAETVDEQT